MTERERTGELLKHQAFQQETINTITQKIQSTVTVEEAMQVAARELGHLFGKKPVALSLGLEEFTNREASNPSLSQTDHN